MNYITGKNVKLGERVTLGDCVRLGKYVTLGDCVRLGDGAIVPDNAIEAIDLGFMDNYRKTLSVVNGIAIITAGCRKFTLTDAIRYWSNHTKNMNLTNAQIQMAVAIANLKGWKHN